MAVLPTLTERLLHRLHLLPTPIHDAFGNVLFGRALVIAVRRGLFEAVAGRPSSCEEIARATRLDLRGVMLVVDSLVEAGYLTRRGRVYAPTGEARKWLLPSSPWYLGSLIAYIETLYGRWQGLEQSLEHGHPPRPYYDGFTDEDWRTYVFGMRDLARLLAPEVVPRIRLPGSPASLLDLGGSHGFYALECCRKYNSLRATIIDFEPALRHAGALVRGAQMESRVRLLAGDFLEMPLPVDQDAVLLFNVIHGLSADANRLLIGRSLACLKPKGSLFILDQMREGKRRTPLGRFVPLMVGLNLLNEIGGTAYSPEEVESWCGAGATVRQYVLRAPGVTLLTVRRKGFAAH